MKSRTLAIKIPWTILAATASALLAANFTFAQTDLGQDAPDERQQLNATQSAVASEGTNRPPFENAPQSSQNLFEPLRVNSINDRIALLKKLIEDERKNETKQASHRQLTRDDPIVDTNPPISAPVPPAEQNASEPEATQQYVPTIPVSNDKRASDTGKTVFTEPVNSFELGNSLYRTKNYAASVKCYEAVLNKNPDDIDKPWLKCLIGCCYRLQGRYSNAETTFRELANQKTAGSKPIDYAKWSLSYIEKRRLARSEFNDIEAELTPLLKEVKDELYKP